MPAVMERFGSKIDYAALQRDPRNHNRWLAIRENENCCEVLARSILCAEVFEAARRAGDETPFVMHIRKPGTLFFY